MVRLPTVNVRNRIEELRRAIRRADDLYYNQADPEIEDSEYDELFRELRALEEEHPGLVTEDSPTRRVGAPLPKGTPFPTAKHLAPMLSIESLTEPGEVEEFVARARRNLGLGEDEALRWTVEPKLDGVSASLLYEDGVLVRGLSRGDGTTGEDITRNLETIRNMPLELKRTKEHEVPRRIEVRGEVIMSREAFARFQGRTETTTETTFRNPRNTVAGTLKLLDPRIVKRRPLDFLAWGVGHAEGLEATTMTGIHGRLEAWGFRTAGPFEVVGGAEGILTVHDRLEARREELEYELDGVVAKVDALSLQHRLGRTARTPRYMLAYKFAPRRGVTVVEEVAAQVGRTGVVTPVAHLRPVDLAGVTVQRATLHNWGLVAERDVREGDEVVVERAGDVIPKVIEVHTERRRKGSRRTRPPESCPTCGSDLEAEGAFLFCVNVDCPDQLRGRIAYLAGRRALDIDRLGPKYIDQLMVAGLLRSVEDVFALPDKRAEIMALEGWGERSYEKLAQEIAKARKPQLDRFINALGIRNVGEQTARDLAAHFGSIDKLAAADEEELIEVDGVGPEVARSIRAFFELDANRRFLEAARAHGVQPQRAAAAGGGELEGRVFCFTGGLSTMSRDEAKSLVEERGARTTNSVSSRVTDVVAGEKAGSKLEKARKLGLRVLDEDGFNELVGRS